MAGNLVTVKPDTPIGEAAERIFNEKLRCLPGLDAENLVGFLTERDFRALLSADR